jgi:hypothetical protein
MKTSGIIPQTANILNTAPPYKQNRNNISYSGKPKQKEDVVEYKKPSFMRKVGGYFIGSWASSAVNIALGLPLTVGILGALHKYKGGSFEENERAAQKMADESGLTKKGFKNLFIDKDNKQQLVDKVLEEIDISTKKSKVAQFKEKCAEKYIDATIGKGEKGTGKALLQSFKKVIAEVYAWMVEKGFNAFYLPETNVAATAKKKSDLIYHEIGHAMNANSSKFAKFAQSAARRIPALVLPITMLTALCHTNLKPKNNEEKSKTTKVLDYIKNNAGKLTFFSFVPMIMEEALASARGIKFVGKEFGTGRAAKIGALYTVALGSYIGAAAIQGYAVKIAGKVRDKIVYPKPKTKVEEN